MRVARLRLVNWRCFRGEHVLDLDPIVYGVHAAYAGDRERSNAAGKSALLGAVKFALTGDHGDGAKDDWISHGEQSGLVVLVADAPRMQVARARTRGKRSSLTLTVDGQPAGVDDVAQLEIYRRLGFTAEDLGATCLFEQGEMSSFITSDPADRVRLVTSWLQLGALERAIGAARERVNAAARERKALASTSHGEDPVPLEVEAQRLALASDEAQAALAALVEAQGREVKLQRRAELERASAGQQLAVQHARERLAAVLDLRLDVEQAQAGVADALAKLTAAEAEHKRRADLARGTFDGACPVNGRVCPISADILAERTRNARRAQESRELAERCHKYLARAREVAEQARLSVDACRGAERDLTRAEDQLRITRAELDALPVGTPGVEPIAQRVQEASERARVAAQEAGAARYRHQAAVAAKARHEGAQAQRERADGALTLARAAHAVLAATHRRVAEGSVAEIEREACGALEACGVGLTVRVRWSREGSGVASACAACGAAFPRSERVKECEACGEKRGPNVVYKMELELSRRSGALLDLAGIAVRLGASAWLRRARGAQWGTAYLDEPLAQCDRANRRAVSAHLAGMLRSRYGFEQALVVSHDPASLEALPGRILIECDGEWSTVRVA